jgi:PGF-CTERM protein
MSEGGFVVIHDSSLLQGQVSESVLGASDYLSEGQSTNVEVTLDEPLGSAQTVIAMPHLDTNGNQAYDFPSADGPYTANGSAVTDSAQYTIATPTATPDTTTTMEPTTTEPTTTEEPDTPTETDEPGTTAEPDTETTTTGGPGFTAGIALVALAAAALLALRRRD